MDVTPMTVTSDNLLKNVTAMRADGETVVGNIDLDELNRRILAAYPTDAVNGPIAIFNDGADDIPLKSFLVNISSTGGVTGANITLCGNNNLFVPFTYSARGTAVEIQSNGTMRAHGTTTSAGWLLAYSTYSLTDIGLEVGDAFTISCSSDAQFSIRFWDSSNAEISRTSAAVNGTPVKSTVPSGTTQLRIICQFGLTQVAIGDSIDITCWYQIEKGEGTLLSIPFPSEAGTVYDGSLDVLAGKLTVNDETYDVTPFEILSELGDNAIYADCGDVSVVYRADTALYVDKKIAESLQGG